MFLGNYNVLSSTGASEIIKFVPGSPTDISILREGGFIRGLDLTPDELEVAYGVHDTTRDPTIPAPPFLGVFSLPVSGGMESFIATPVFPFGPQDSVLFGPAYLSNGDFLIWGVPNRFQVTTIGDTGDVMRVTPGGAVSPFFLNSEIPDQDRVVDSALLATDENDTLFLWINAGLSSQFPLLVIREANGNIYTHDSLEIATRFEETFADNIALGGASIFSMAAHSSPDSVSLYATAGAIKDNKFSYVVLRFTFPTISGVDRWTVYE